jgi:hypothetical protein
MHGIMIKHGQLGHKLNYFLFFETFERKKPYCRKLQKFRLQESGIKSWPNTNKHISCEHTNHKENRKIMKLNYNLIRKFLISQKLKIKNSHCEF